MQNKLKMPFQRSQPKPYTVIYKRINNKIVYNNYNNNNKMMIIKVK